MLLVNIMVFVIFPLLIVHKAVLNRNGYNEDVFTKKDTMAMRGIAACGIMFSHYVVALEELNFPVGPAKFYEPVGGMGVCVFFFLSGYGLSASKRPMTLKFLTDRVKKIYLPYVAMRLLFGCLPKMDEISPGGVQPLR